MGRWSSGGWSARCAVRGMAGLVGAVAALAGAAPAQVDDGSLLQTRDPIATIVCWVSFSLHQVRPA